jgi:hypothetical protein
MSPTGSYMISNVREGERSARYGVKFACSNHSIEEGERTGTTATGDLHNLGLPSLFPIIENEICSTESLAYFEFCR